MRRGRYTSGIVFACRRSNGRFVDAWKPFLTRDGGMVGDLHSLMYVVGEENRRARLDLEMPAEWTAASGLEPTGNPRSFTGSTELMLDSPIMIGKLKQWNFDAAGVPHSVVIWSASASPATDRDTRHRRH